MWLASIALALAVAGTALITIAWWSSEFVRDDLDEELYAEVIELMQGPLRQGPEALATEIRRRILEADSLGHVYLYAESRETIIEGSWPTWPDDATDDIDISRSKE